MSVSLDKKVEQVQSLTTRLGIPDAFKLAVKFQIDVSGSTRGMFDDGTVQNVVDRLLGVAVRFDDNQSMECYAYGDKAARLSDVTPESFGNYVQNKFLPEAKNAGVLWGGTMYAPAFKLALKDSGGRKGMFGFGAKKAEPTYLIFVTDGDNGDRAQAEELLRDFEGQNTYVHLIGVGRGSSFSWLKQMADKYSHVGFATFPDIETVSDEAMYERLLTGELATWIRGL